MQTDRRQQRRLVILAALAVWLPVLSQVLSAAETTAPRSNPAPPFLQLRETTLSYHDLSPDLTNLSEIRLGWFGPTDLSNPVTGGLWWTVNHAIAEANKDARRPIRLIPRWAVDPWGTGVSQLTRMVYDDQPLALIGSVDSAATHLAEQIAAKANLPLVSPVVTDNSATLAGVPWMFSCAPSDTAVARAVVDAVVREANGPVVVLAATGHESRMTARELMRAFARKGRLPDLRLDFEPGKADLSPWLARAEKAGPSVLVIIAGVEDSARLCLAVRESPALHSAVIFGGPAMSRHQFLELTGTGLGNVRRPSLVGSDGHAAARLAFTTAFTSARGHEPDDAALLTWDATRLLLQAIRQAGPNRDRVRQALLQLSPWTGAAGVIRFDGTGQNIRTNVSIKRLHQGRWMD